VPNLLIGLILGYLIAAAGISKVTPAQEQLPIAAIESPTVEEIEAVAKTAEHDEKDERIYKVTFMYATLQEDEPTEFLKDSFMSSMKKGDSTYGWEVNLVDTE